jgi:hypothetical protein
VSTRFNMKQYDLLPVLRLELLDGTTPVDLTLASEVRLLLKNRSAGLKVNAVMDKLTQTGDTLGQVEYEWQVGDTDTLGTFQMEVQVMWPGSLPQSFPPKGYNTLSINRDLNQGPTTEESS